MLRQSKYVRFYYNLYIFPIRLMHSKRLELYKKCYTILGVDESTDQDTLRKVYIALVKKIHPDSGHKEASAERFHEIDEAFRILQEKYAKKRRGIPEEVEEEEKEFDIRHTAPQHRQYLSFDGLGFGNPFQREKQYQQVKAMKAQGRVLNHRIEKSQAGEKTLMKKGSFYKRHAIKTKYGFDRVVEDLIQEAMSKGDFNNLKGSGKPLSSAQSQNPYLDFTTHKLNKILLDNGFTPEWIMAQKEIRNAIQNLKESIIEERQYFGEYPFPNKEESIKWQLTISAYQSDVIEINKKIDKFNLIVPILQNQLFRIDLEQIAEEVLRDKSLIINQNKPSPEVKIVDSRSTPAYSDFLSFLGSWF